MQSSLQKKAVTGFLLAVLIFIGVAFVFYHSMNSFIDTAAARKRSFYTIIYLERLFSDLKDAETGQRGYLLTGKHSYLMPFEAVKTKFNKDMDDLKRVLLQSEAQGKRFNRLEKLSRNKLNELSQTIELRKTKGFAASLAVVNSDRGKRDMDEIRRIVTQMARYESDRADAMDQRLHKNANKTFVIASMSGLLGFTLFLSVFIMLIKEMRSRQRVNRVLEQQAEERERTRGQIEELNASLEEQVVALNSLNKELESFSYSVSHDLRAPLRSIDGFSQALLDMCSDQLDDTAKDFLGRIRANSQRMAQLIDDMLQLSRLTRGEMTIDTVDLSAIANHLAQELQTQEAGRKVTFHIAEGLVVQGDNRLLQAVMQNLLHNAWKFTSHHETATIVFDKTLKDGKTTYYVRDDGAGFEMEYVDKLFGAFQRLHAMHEFPGTGIGLATVQRIIHRHGGHVWAEGEPEKGATFYFTINT